MIKPRYDRSTKQVAITINAASVSITATTNQQAWLELIKVLIYELAEPDCETITINLKLQGE
jgi:hypothetical protein